MESEKQELEQEIRTLKESITTKQLERDRERLRKENLDRQLADLKARMEQRQAEMDSKKTRITYILKCDECNVVERCTAIFNCWSCK